MSEELKPLQRSEYKNLISEFFNYTWDWDFLDIVASCLERVDYEELIKMSDDEISDLAREIIDNELIYTDDQWTVIKHYQNPSEADFMDAMDSLEIDIRKLLEKIRNDAE